tara:strand:+ start:1145 stop:1588 length:444 start_codon:yes stop_codon:yes gene_type:complete
MANPLIHSKSSVKRWGGKVEDYIAIHELIDSPKATMNNNSSRALTHNTWFAYTIIPKIFGYNITNSNGRSVDTVDIAMLHIAEDFRMKFVPTPQDYLKHMEVQAWFSNGVKDVNNPEATKVADDLKERLSRQSRKDLDKRMTENNIK